MCDRERERARDEIKYGGIFVCLGRREMVKKMIHIIVAYKYHTVECFRTSKYSENC